MDIKDQVRQRIAELTRFAYERGFRDGAQSALTEMEVFGSEDVVEQLSKEPAALKAIPGKKAVAKKPVKAKAAKATKTKPAKATKSEPTAKAKANGKERAKSKSSIVREALQALLAEKGEARRDEVLAAAQAANPAITKHDLANGLRAMAKRSAFRVSPEDGGLLLPAG